MTTNPDRRSGPDRRTRPRGGRRPYDVDGATPLVLVADEEAGSRAMSETILAKLHFAVAPVDSVAKALGVMSTLRPDVVVARVRDAGAFRDQSATPVVIVTDQMSDPDVLVEAIRDALRARRAS